MLEMESRMQPEEEMEVLERPRNPSPNRAMGLIPTPELIVYREVMGADGHTPEVVQIRLKELRERQQQIAEMWIAEKSPKGYIPFTEEARRMKMQAKLSARVQSRFESNIAQQVREVQRTIDETDTVESKPIDIF
jgi:hypothetical protein